MISPVVHAVRIGRLRHRSLFKKNLPSGLWFRAFLLRGCTLLPPPSGDAGEGRRCVGDPVRSVSIEPMEEALEERIDAGRYMGLSQILHVLRLSGGDA
jgi:hypothetical protein